MISEVTFAFTDMYTNTDLRTHVHAPTPGIVELRQVLCSRVLGPW